MGLSVSCLCWSKFRGTREATDSGRAEVGNAKPCLENGDSGTARRNVILLASNLHDAVDTLVSSCASQMIDGALF